MIGFESQISEFKYDRSTNCATTTATNSGTCLHIRYLLCVLFARCDFMCFSIEIQYRVFPPFARSLFLTYI